MKKLNLNLLLLLFAGSILTFTSCKKVSDVPEFEGLSFEAEKILAKVPTGLKNSSDSYASQCYSGIESAVDMSSFISDLDPPEDAIGSSLGSDTWQWTVSDGMNSITFYWRYEEDSQKKYWTMDIQVNGGTTFSYITAWESKDGLQGEVLYNFNWVSAYDSSSEEFEELYWKYSWNVDADGNYTFSWKYDSDSDDYEYFLSYEVILNDDGSGTIDYYSMGSKFYHMEWDVSGNGSWTYYYEGMDDLNGSWSI